LLSIFRRLPTPRGGGGAGATAPGSAAAALAVAPLPGLPVAASRDAKMGRLGAMRDAGDPPPGPAETPSGGCGKDGFFLRLSHLLNYRNNSAAVLLSCDVVGSLPASLMDGSAPCCRWSLTISARPQNTAICNGVSPSLFQAFGYAPRLRRFHDLDAALKRRLAASSRIYPWRLDLPHL